MATEPIPHAADEDVRFEEVSPDEARRIFDEAARYYLGISSEEFVRRYEAGQYDDAGERPDLCPKAMPLVLLLPFARA